MVIVIIHWKIHRHEEARRAFLDHWRDTLTISERSHLVGEYLSRPLSEKEARFPCVVMNSAASSTYDSYYNVGIWNDLDSFRREVIDPYVSSKPKTAAFEFAFRERMVLQPLSWRAGEDQLPTSDESA